MFRSNLLPLALALTGLGCPQPASEGPDGSIGPEGGTIERDGVRLEIPAGALSAPQRIAIQRSSAAVPAGLVGLSSVYLIEPEGLGLAVPAEMTFRVEGDASRAAVYWFEGGAYRRLDGQRDGQEISVPVTQLSRGFVASETPSLAGTLDVSFGAQGKLLLGVEGHPMAMAIQPDDRILLGVGGVASTVLVRLEPDGQLDPTFGSGGRAALPDWLPYGSLSGPSGVLGLQSTGPAMAVEDDGKIVVALTVQAPDSAYRKITVLIRYDRHGQPDPSFGGSGVVTIDFDSTKLADLLVGGLTTTHAGGVEQLVLAGLYRLYPDDVPFVARFDRDGHLDASLGHATAPVTGWRATNGVAVDADGSIVVVGDSYSDQHLGMTLLRLQAAGTLDASFAGNGTIRTGFGSGSSYGRALLVQPDGRIVAGGVAVCATSLACPGDFAVGRWLADGTPDPSFGTSGVVTIYNGIVEAMASRPDGTLWLGGGGLANEVVDLGGGWGLGSPGTFSVGRLSSAGVLDSELGPPSSAQPAGIVRTGFGDAYTRLAIKVLGVQSSGRVIAAGAVGAYDDEVPTQIGLARYWP